jgi:hypothetical protein
VCILLPEQYRCIWLVTTSTHTGALAPLPEPGTQEAIAYTDGASTGSRGLGGYGAVMTWKGKTEEILISAEVAKRYARIGSWITHFQEKLATGVKEDG